MLDRLANLTGTYPKRIVAVAVIDVGKPTAAVLFVSIPGTHRQWDYVVDEVLASVRPTCSVPVWRMKLGSPRPYAGPDGRR